MTSQFLKDIAALEPNLESQQRTHANRIRVLDDLAEMNRRFATDAEIAQELLSTGLPEQEVRRRLKVFEGVVIEMVNSLSMHVRLDALERAQSTKK